MSSKLTLTSDSLSKEIDTNKHVNEFKAKIIQKIIEIKQFLFQLKEESSRLHHEIENCKYKINELNKKNAEVRFESFS